MGSFCSRCKKCEDVVEAIALPVREILSEQYDTVKKGIAEGKSMEEIKKDVIEDIVEDIVKKVV